jgi:hypothetical protein
MRDRATKSEASADGEPWYPADEMHGLIGGGSRNTADAEHIASWHPAVALAVADWLDDTDTEGHHPDESCCGACEVARAYLGGDQ